MDMAEEIVGEFNAIQSVSEEHGVGKSCILFLTNSRVIVVEIEGVSSIVFLIPIVLFIVGLAGLLLRELLVLLIGVTAAIVSSLSLIGVNYVVQNQRLKRTRKLAPDQIVRLSNNFDIPYAKIGKIELKRHEEFRGGGANILLPSFPEYKWTVYFSMQSEEDRGYVFILKGNVMAAFKERIKQYIPDIFEFEPLQKSIFERNS